MNLRPSHILHACADRAARALPSSWGERLRRQPILVLVVPLIAAALLMRLNNAIRYPSLHGFDSYAHATYIWHLILTGSVPLASDGWGRFHPPLYYAICAAIWWPLKWMAPLAVLKVLNVVFGAIGLVSGLVAFVIARHYLADRRVFAWAALLFVLYFPVHVYTAPMLGNEGLSTVFCSIALFLLVRLLESERLRYAVLLGLTLGLALMTKFTAIVIVGSAFATLGLWTLMTRRWKDGIARGAVVAVCLLSVSGWFYARNFENYGNPFQMSRDYFATKRIEATIAVGERTWKSYLGFDTSVFKQPMVTTGPVLDSVWAGVYATAWFDAHGDWFLPSAIYNSTMHAVGRILLAGGLVPTVVLFIGLFTGLWRLRIRGPDPVLLTMLATTACMIAMFVIYTHENRIYTAVKASYMLPAIVPAAFWFALGLKTIADRSALLLTGTSLAMLGLVAVVLPVYSYRVLFHVPLGPHFWNSVAVLEYLAGFPDLARQKLEAIAQFDSVDQYSNLYLAHENLSSLALEEGDLHLALVELRRARSLVTAQAPGQPEDVLQFLRGIDAEYWNSLAVIYDELGWKDLALTSALNAVRVDPTLPEAHFDQGLLLWERRDYEAAATAFDRAATLDPGFGESLRMLAVSRAQAGRCDEALEAMEKLEGKLPPRRYPAAVGTGELHDAAFLRRRHIAVPDEPVLKDALASCRESVLGNPG